VGPDVVRPVELLPGGDVSKPLAWRGPFRWMVSLAAEGGMLADLTPVLLVLDGEL